MPYFEIQCYSNHFHVIGQVAGLSSAKTLKIQSEQLCQDTRTEARVIPI